MSNAAAAKVDHRQERGLALAKNKAPRFRHIAGDTCLVPSATSAGAAYVVDVGGSKCTCPDFEERGLPCKHLWAVRYFRHELAMPDGSTVVTEVERTAANGFDVREVSADKAYLSHESLAIVEKVGGVPYVPFKVNSGCTGSAAWGRMWHLYSLERETFLAHYHKRSNVEATFSAIKRKFGPSVRSKLLPAQLNEVLLKCLCHNLSTLVHSIHELGIDPKFWMPQSAAQSAAGDAS